MTPGHIHQAILLVHLVRIEDNQDLCSVPVYALIVKISVLFGLNMVSPSTIYICIMPLRDNMKQKDSIEKAEQFFYPFEDSPSIIYVQHIQCTYHAA